MDIVDSVNLQGVENSVKNKWKRSAEKNRIDAYIYPNHQRQKGKSLLQLPDDYVVIDLETTGLSSYYDKIIELAAIKIKDNKTIDTFSTLCNPEIEIDDFITNLTGITNNMVKDAPKIKDILEDYIAFIGDSILVGHYINFDVNFIYDYYGRRFIKRFSNDDTWRLSRKVFPELEHHRLSDMVEYLGVENKKAHRALSDCIATYNIYLELKNYIIKNNILLKSKNNSWHPKYDLRKIQVTTDDIDETNPFYKKYCVFTGKLEKMPRKDAAQIVVNLGGINADIINQKTNFLILGNNDYCTTIKDGKSTKHKKAEQYILKGQDLQIIPENVFYDIVEEYFSDQEIPKSSHKPKVVNYIKRTEEQEARIAELERIIPLYQAAYYHGKAELSDSEFDCLWDELKRLDPNSPVLTLR
jgi:DNA polymerase-3 subunit epsilon